MGAQENPQFLKNWARPKKKYMGAWWAPTKKTENPSYLKKLQKKYFRFFGCNKATTL